MYLVFAILNNTEIALIVFSSFAKTNTPEIGEKLADDIFGNRSILSTRWSKSFVSDNEFKQMEDVVWYYLTDQWDHLMNDPNPTINRQKFNDWLQEVERKWGPSL